MKIPLTFLILLFFPLLIKTNQTKNTIYLPLVHVSTENYFPNKVISPPLMSPRAHRGLMYIAEIYFGSVKQYLHVDTGSTFTWINCHPCSHCLVDNIYPKYRPAESETYFDAFCEATEKDSNPRFTYSRGRCNYELQYADDSTFRGTLSLETIKLETLDGGFETVEDVYFGCNYQALGHYDGTGTGLLGLGLGKYSLVEKLGSRFSFCFGQIKEGTSTHNLILGDGAVIQGHPTVVNIEDGLYMFQLESVLVDEKKTLDKPLQVVLDTGTSICHFSSDLFRFIVARVDKLIGYRFRILTYGSLLCYQVGAQEIPDQIDISFIFAGGAELRVDVRSLLVPNGSPGILCLAIDEIPKNKRGEDIHPTLIGAVAMQGYNFGYDLKAKTVYFQKRTCNV
ncbi:hypothetical protein EUTSA_v10025401mg [Eutrema salsugineum]|uniref:Peptidase A1 domain-containing protein n=1 Tax=Eutrema salsugineum TaxID=72664 RepID=V4MG12_EUTSA|nr:hypothetical protein EUTSA_v10025401mg [Eutrema salsugineum]